MSKMFKIHKIDSVDSTNETARDFPENHIIVADTQKKGKGRFEREWTSKKGGLWFSIILKPKRKICEYTFIASLAVHDSLDFKTDIKWPNDIYYKGKKLCGILTEVISIGNSVDKITVGIGLNVNNKSPKEAISIKDILGKEIDKDKILEKIIKNFIRYKDEDLGDILNAYKEKCITIGKKVKVDTLDGIYEGRAVDIDKEGNLILDTGSKKIKLTEGDASII